MLLAVLIFVFLFAGSKHQIFAQPIPIYYQLLFAFQPSTLITAVSPISTTDPTPTPSPTIAPQVLGVTSSISPSPSPFRVGGDGQVVTVALLGDSMIDTLGKTPTLLKALQQRYPGKKFNIINFGVGASNIEYALYRLTHDYSYNDQNYPSLISQKPDIIVVESFAYNNFGNSQSGFDRQWQALGSITGTIKDKLPQSKIIIAATITPNSITFADGSPNLRYSALEKVEKTSTINLYLENAINFATSENFPLANVYHFSSVNNDGNPDLISSKDHLHPSARGSQLIENTIFQAIVDNQLL